MNDLNENGFTIDDVDVNGIDSFKTSQMTPVNIGFAEPCCKPCICTPILEFME